MIRIHDIFRLCSYRKSPPLARHIEHIISTAVCRLRLWQSCLHNDFADRTLSSLVRDPIIESSCSNATSRRIKVQLTRRHRATQSPELLSNRTLMLLPKSLDASVALRVQPVTCELYQNVQHDRLGVPFSRTNYPRQPNDSNCV
jgi:hypothetical protein